jgi:F0F1-type ATP synthase membrane subunit b/b'
MITVRMTGGEAIKDMENELTKVIEDFDRAVDVEALSLAKKLGKRSQSQSGDSSFTIVSCRAKLSA